MKNHVPNSLAVYLAQQCACNLQEIAKTNNLNPHAIKILDNRSCRKNGFHHAGAGIVWTEGPSGWAFEYSPVGMGEAHYAAVDGHTILFYD